ncbi:hypothetical protein BDZ89DRAFT_1086108 [Hymenopellis radicata]|nr:hypothetical protein BDZ89DRAFT_1086108 [Hymenopellis radicata]
MSQDFTATTRRAIQDRFGRCALCCALPPVLHHCHILEKAEKSGDEQSVFGGNWGLIPKDYNGAGSLNGMSLCPTCHLSYMTGNGSSAPICFVPCAEILQYLIETAEFGGPDIDQVRVVSLYNQYQLLTPEHDRYSRNYAQTRREPKPLRKQNLLWIASNYIFSRSRVINITLRLNTFHPPAN